MGPAPGGLVGVSPVASRKGPLLAAALIGIIAVAVGAWVLRRPAPAPSPAAGAAAAPDGYAEIGCLEAAGRVREALESAEAGLARRPGDRDLLLLSARLRWGIGDYRTAEDRFRQAIAGEPRPGPIWLALARLAEGTACFPQAVTAAGKALEADPGIAGARGIIARQQIAANRFEEARDLLEPPARAGKADREERIALGRALVRLGDHGGAEESFRKAWALPGPADPEGICARAEALNGLGRFQEAADLLAARLLEDPHHGRASFLLGTALVRMGRREAAAPLMKAYESALPFERQRAKVDEIERSGLRGRAAYERAPLLAQEGRHRQAVDACRRAALLSPLDGEVLAAAARHLAGSEATLEALEVLFGAVDRKVEPRPAILALRASVLRGARRAAEAAADVAAALALDPRHPEALLERGLLLLDEGKAGEAGEAFGKAREAAPERWEPAWRLGRLALDRGDPAAALEALAEAERLAGGPRPEVRASLGLALVRAGRREEGLPALLEALRADPLLAEAAAGLEEGMGAAGDERRAATAAARKREIEAILDRLGALRASPLPFEGRGTALLEIGRLLRSAGALREAFRYVALARSAAPDLAEAHRAAADLAEGPELAFIRGEALEAVLRASPGDPQAARDLAAILDGLGVLRSRSEELARLAGPRAKAEEKR